MQPICSASFCLEVWIQTLCLVSVLLLLNESVVFVWKSKNLRSTSWFGSLAGCMMKWRAENNNSDLWHRLYLIFLILATLESSKARGVCVCLCLSPCVCMWIGMGSDTAQLPNNNSKSWLVRHYQTTKKKTKPCGLVLQMFCITYWSYRGKKYIYLKRLLYWPESKVKFMGIQMKKYWSQTVTSCDECV